MANCIKISSELTLYSGDVITIQADDGTYLKVYDSLKGHPAIESYKHERDEYSTFVVSVLGPNKIYLQAEYNSKFLKRCDSWKGMSFISVDKDVPDNFSTFIVEPLDVNGYNNSINLKFSDDGHFIKRYHGSHGRNVMVGTNGTSRYTTMTANRVGVDCTEVVEDMVFDTSNTMPTVKPQIIATQHLVNGTNVQQTETFTVSQTVATKQSFTWSEGFSLDVSTSFETKVPMVFENDTTIDVDTTFTKGGTVSTEDEKTFNEEFPVQCPAMSTIVASAVVQMGKMDVNYIATVARYLEDNSGQKRKYTFTVPGVFHSVNAFDCTYTLQQESTSKL